MTADKKLPEVKSIIQVLLDESERVSRRVYRSSFTFLILGLLVASAGVSYFYFSNDALVLDRAFYEDQINTLTTDKSNLIKDNHLLVRAGNKQAELDSVNLRKLSSTIGFNGRILNSYVRGFNDLIDAIHSKDGNSNSKIVKILGANSKAIDTYTKQYNAIPAPNLGATKADREIADIVKKYKNNLAFPSKIPNMVNSYDKPELVFSPKLVYGFFSRLGGLIFIELVAFYLLKQYRVNMNDFKYYNAITTQARANLYLVNMAEKLEDDRSKIEILSKILSPTSEILSTSNPDDSSISLSSSELELAKKILDLVKK